MKIIKSYWLEWIFAILILVVIALSAKNAFRFADIDYGKHLERAGDGFDADNMADYLSQIKECSNDIAVIVVKDIQGYFLSQDDVEALKNLGFDKADVLLEQEYHSFIGIWSEGQAVYQCVGGDESIECCQYLNNHCIYAKSATYNTGNVGDIYIDDVQYSVNNRGFNIVILEGDRLIDSVAYDVYVENVSLYRLIDGNITEIE